LIAAWRFGALEVVLSDFILAELRRTLPRLVHRHGLTPEAIDDLIDTLAILAELVEPEAVVENELTDHADLPVLGTLLAALRLGLAQTLVTGDKALLTLRDRFPSAPPQSSGRRMEASDRSAASSNHQAQLSESSGSRPPALGLRRGCSVLPWFCGELDQALTAFAGEGIGDGGAALLEGGVGLAWWRRPGGVNVRRPWTRHREARWGSTCR
jgi:predicted nucleic acid-binding protein